MLSKLCGRPPKEGWNDSEGYVYLEIDRGALLSESCAGLTSFPSESSTFADDSYFLLTYPDNCTPCSSYCTG